MEIVKCSKDNVVRKIKEMQKIIDKHADKKSTVQALQKAQNVFSTQVKNEGVAIRCSEEEIGPLVFDYLEMLSHKHHLAMCVFVEQGVGVYSIKNVKRLTDCSTFSLILPHNSYDDNIVIFVCYYKSYEGEVYDIDLFSKRFCS